MFTQTSWHHLIIYPFPLIHDAIFILYFLVVLKQENNKSMF